LFKVKCEVEDFAGGITGQGEWKIASTLLPLGPVSFAITEDQWENLGDNDRNPSNPRGRILRP